MFIKRGQKSADQVFGYLVKNSEKWEDDHEYEEAEGYAGRVTVSLANASNFHKYSLGFRLIVLAFLIGTIIRLYMKTNAKKE
jgi:hypothetical protein